eukprot:TRINITY_DN9665_c0_g1_i1.p1 TRINITY_DN9665_c0_g1~~TRINITY_DN9665_c0_g1_i1.p1  ORF type:complete len:189 (+),score=6.27 TRINITY_DN9665_c0_g1_i1:88-654(+)
MMSLIAPRRGKQVRSLEYYCLSSVIAHLDQLQDLGDIPEKYKIKIFRACDPDQLLELERHNSPINTENIWRTHCLKQFKLVKSLPGVTWKEMFINTRNEKARRMEALKKKYANMNRTEVAKRGRTETRVVEPPAKKRRGNSSLGRNASLVKSSTSPVKSRDLMSKAKFQMKKERSKSWRLTGMRTSKR